MREGMNPWRRWLLGLGLPAMLALAYGWGRLDSLPRASAQAPAPPPDANAGSDYSKRVVAYVYGSTPITREDFGEFLIARNTDKLELLVNKRIIEIYCQQKGIEVTAAEVEAAIMEDCRVINVNLKDFITNVLKKYNKTLYEWREDVVRPRLLLAKLCRDRVKVTPEDLKKAFDAYHGEKRECRILLYPYDMERQVLTNLFGKVRDSEEEFDRAAHTQPIPSLAAQNGKLPAFGRGTTGNDEMEKVAFNLRPGEVSGVLRTPEGLLIIKLDKIIPPDTTVKLEDVRAKLEKECFDKRVQLEIPKVFEEMKKQAMPKMILNTRTTEEELVRFVQEELKGKPGNPGPPNGN